MADQVAQVLVEIGHKAWYRKKATPEKTHDWILFVRGPDGNDISHFVEKIVFNLHQSFNPPKRVLKSPPYELRESGYGEFMPIIDIYFKNKGEKGAQRKVTIQYYLNLNREDSPPIDNIRPEKLKFYSPAEEFLEKVLRAGGVILGSDGCPLPPSKPSLHRPSSVVDIQPSNNSSSSLSQTLFHDSRNHDASDFLVDVDSAAKSASQLAKKRKRSTEANPMSNDSNSSNESNGSRRSSSKSDPLEKDSDARGSAGGTKQKMHAALFESTDDDSAKKKKKAAAPEKHDSSKSRSVEQKSTKVESTTVEDNAKQQHRSSKDERHKHSSSSSGKSHHRRDADDSGGRRDHRSSEKDGGHGGGGGGHSKPKSEDRNSRSSSRTPSKVKSLESLSGSRVHGGGGSSSHGISSTHHRSSSSSSSRHHSNTKSSKVEGGGSSSLRHGGSSQSQKNGESSNHHRGSSSSSSSKHHRLSSTSEQNVLQRKTSSDIQIRLSPIDSVRSGSSSRKLETTTSSANRIGPSPDGFSGGKPNDLSPMKKRPKNPAAASPAGYPPPTFDLSNGVSTDPFSASTNRSIRPKYDKLLDDMKSDDEEEDGEIRSPVATEPPPELLLPWKPTSSDRKDEKSKETSSSFDSHKKSRTSSSSTNPRLEKPERFPFGAEKPSPTKVKGDWSSSMSSEKTSPDDSSSFSGSQVKAKKSHAKENVADGESKSSKKSSVSKSGGNQKDFSSVGQRTSSSSTKQKGLLPPTDFSSFAVKSESDEKSDAQNFKFKVDSQWDNSYEAISKSQDAIVAIKKETELYGVKSESTFYDDKKCIKIESSLKKETTTTMVYSDRAANGELLMSLVEMKEKINRVTSAILLNRIVDVIQAAGKLKSDDDALEFDFCQLDSETMIRVKQILETVSD